MKKLKFVCLFIYTFHPHPRTCLLILEREGRVRRRKTPISWILYMPRPGTKPATQACALMGNWTDDLLVYKIMLQPTEPHWPGLAFFFFLIKILLIFREKGKEEEGEWNTSVWLPLLHPLLGTWPATQVCALWLGINQRHFGSQVRAQSTELYQPGLAFLVLVF